MAWFGGKKKPKRKPPVLEPVGSPAVQAAPAAVQAAPAAVQAAPVAQPALEPVQPNQGIPAIQAVPASQPVVEVAPVGDEGVEDHRSEAEEGEAHHEEGIRHRTRDHEQDDVEWRERNAPTLECVPGVRLRMRARGAARHDG